MFPLPSLFFVAHPVTNIIGWLVGWLLASGRHLPTFVWNCDESCGCAEILRDDIQSTMARYLENS